MLALKSPSVLETKEDKVPECAENQAFLLDLHFNYLIFYSPFSLPSHCADFISYVPPLFVNFPCVSHQIYIRLLSIYLDTAIIILIASAFKKIRLPKNNVYNSRITAPLLPHIYGNILVLLRGKFCSFGLRPVSRGAVHN